MNPSDRALLARTRLDRTFAIVTGCDPMGVQQDEAANRMRTVMLQMEVGRLGVAWVNVDACSVDGAHCEASFAIAAPLEASVALAARFDQLGIFWFDGAVFWIIPVRSGNPRMRLPPHA